MKKHLRIAALQCNFQTREQTLAMPEFWKEFGFDTEQLLHTHADMYSAVYEEKVHGKLLEEYLQNLKKCSMNVIVYMNCHILGPSIADRKEEWGVRNASGGYPLSYGTYPACCLNSSWVDYFFECVESLKKFDIQGLFFDGPPYHTCYCPRCQAKFEKIYGKKHSEATKEELERFTYETVIAFKDALYSKVKSVDPNWLMYFNEGLFVGRADSKNFVRQLASNDIVGTEGGFFYYIPPKDHDTWYCSSSAKVAEAVAGERPTVIFFAGDHKSWGWYMHTPAETKLCYISAIGNGASVWYGIHCDPANLRSKTGETIRQLVQFDKKYDALYQNTRSVADTAVFYSYDTAANYHQTALESDFYGQSTVSTKFHGDYRKAVQGAFGLCSHLNLPWDAVCELNLQDLARYKAIIAPNLAMVSDKTCEALLDYVKKGGIIIADAEFGIYNEKGNRRTHGAFAEAAGVEFTGNYLDHKTFNYCAFPNFYQADNAQNWLPAPAWSVEFSHRKDVEIFGKASKPMEGCYEMKPPIPAQPYAVRTAYGKGAIIYIAGAAFEHYYDFTDAGWREFFNQLIHTYSGNDFVLHNVTSGVCVTVRESAENCTLIHLTNYTSLTRPITRSSVQHDVIIEVPEKFTRATELWNDVELEKVAPGKFMLKKLEEIAVIKLV